MKVHLEKIDPRTIKISVPIDALWKQSATYHLFGDQDDKPIDTVYSSLGSIMDRAKQLVVSGEAKRASVMKDKGGRLIYSYVKGQGGKLEPYVSKKRRDAPKLERFMVSLINAGVSVKKVEDGEWRIDITSHPDIHKQWGNKLVGDEWEQTI